MDHRHGQQARFRRIAGFGVQQVVIGDPILGKGLFIAAGGGHAAGFQVQHAQTIGGFPFRVPDRHPPGGAVGLAAIEADAAPHGHNAPGKAGVLVDFQGGIAGRPFAHAPQIHAVAVVPQGSGVVLGVDAQELIADGGEQFLNLGILRQGGLLRVEIPQGADRQNGGVIGPAAGLGHKEGLFQHSDGAGVQLQPFSAGGGVELFHIGIRHPPGNQVFQLRHCGSGFRSGLFGAGSIEGLLDIGAHGPGGGFIARGGLGIQKHTGQDGRQQDDTRAGNGRPFFQRGKGIRVFHSRLHFKSPTGSGPFPGSRSLGTV